MTVQILSRLEEALQKNNKQLRVQVDNMRNANARMGARLRQIYIAIDRDDLIVTDVEGETRIVSNVSKQDVNKRRGRYT